MWKLLVVRKNYFETDEILLGIDAATLRPVPARLQDVIYNPKVYVTKSMT